jgi:hypothetical protein
MGLFKIVVNIHKQIYGHLSCWLLGQVEMLYLLKKENIDAVMLKWIDHERISLMEIQENLT